MNTLTLARNLLEAALRLAAPEKRITALTVNVGQLLDVGEDDLRSAWEQLTAGTRAEGARLDVRYVPAEFSCMICRRLFKSEREDPACPYCGSLGAKIEHGEECLLQSIELEDGTCPP